MSPHDDNRFTVRALAAAFLLASASIAQAADPIPAMPRALTLNASLSSPWGLAFLPDGRMLVTQKGGAMRILSNDGKSILATVSGVPAVASSGQGGLLDVAIDPDFALDPWVYWSYAEAGTGPEAGLAGTAVARGRLVGNALQDVAVIYRQVPKVGGTGHFGSRLAFRADKTLFVTLGERQLGSPAQDLATTLGKVVRINRDGTIPAGNPAIPGARPETWSYGHRNPQGAAIHPQTGELWANEHGPQGGDELNRVAAGGNFGWPLVSYGCNYGAPVGDACRIGGGTHAPAYVEPVSYWVPTSVAPAGLAFYTGNGFPQWQGSALMGALAGQALWRVSLSGTTEVARESLFGAMGERFRDVRQGPDGWVYALTDSGKLLKILQQRARGDADADRRSDLFWREASGHGFSWWLVRGTAVAATPYFSVDASWQVGDVGDLDGDGMADVVWRRASDGATYLWTLDQVTVKGTASLGALDPAQWALAGAADLDGNGKADLVWRGADGTVYAWLMDGGTIAAQGAIANPGAQWVIADFADLDGDGRDDIVFRNAADGGVYAWLMNGLAIASGGFAGLVDPAAWTLAGAADFSGDGKADLLWRHASGDTWVWLMNGAAFQSAGGIGNPGTGWAVRSLGDFDGDGKADILWRHTDGSLYLARMNGAAVAAWEPMASPGGSWQVVAP